MRTECPNHYPYTLGMALNEYKIITSIIIYYINNDSGVFLYSFNVLMIIYRDNIRAEGQNHYPYTLGMALRGSIARYFKISKNLE